MEEQEVEAARKKVEAAIQVIRIVADTIRELGSVPSGPLYS